MTRDEERVLVIERLLDAPRELVFAAWTQPEHVRHWMAPRRFTVVSSSAELRVGGRWHMAMLPPDGPELRAEGVYRDVAPPERLVFTHAWREANGSLGVETLVTVTLADEAGRTRLTLRQALFPSVEERDGHREGWSECLDLLSSHLATTVRAGGRHR